MTAQGDFYQRDRAWHPQAYTPNYKTSALRAPRCPLVPVLPSLSELTGPLLGAAYLIGIREFFDAAPLGARPG